MVVKLMLTQSMPINMAFQVLHEEGKPHLSNTGTRSELLSNALLNSENNCQVRCAKDLSPGRPFFGAVCGAGGPPKSPERSRP